MNKKLLSLLLAVFMIVGILAPMAAFAGAGTEPGTEDNVTGKTKTVTVHKLIMEKGDLDKWTKEASDSLEKSATNPDGYDGSNTLDLDAVKDKLKLTNAPTEIDKVYFAWQNEAEQYIDEKGQPVQVNEAGTAAGTHHYITPDDPAFTKLVLGAKTGTNGAVFHTWQLPEGTYKIQEIHSLSSYVGPNGETITGSQAVPVVITLPLENQDGVIADAHVYPKNTEDKPPIDKNFQEPGANATKPNTKETKDYTVGDSIPYHVQTIVPKDAKYKTLKFTDTMSKGLTFNNDVVITTSPDLGLVDGDYTIDNRQDGFTLIFKDSGLTKLETAAKTSAVTIDLKYTATLNSNAVVDVPEKNDVVMEYGNNPSSENEPKEIPNVTQITVKKSWADSETPPAGVTVTYVLYEKVDLGDGKVAWKEVKRQEGTGTDLGTTFTDLDSKKIYKVVEIVNGYTPEYTYDTGDGILKIKNTKRPDNPDPIKPTPPEVVTHGKKFVKTNQDGTERLAGAEFVVKNAEVKYLAMKHDKQIAEENADYNAKEQAYKDAVDAYNAAVAASKPQNELDELKAKIEPAKRARDEALKTSNFHYYWTEKIDEAHVLISDDQGRFEIKGLKAGSYNLEEIKAPVGYAKRTDDISFVVGSGSYSSAGVDIKYNPEDAENNAQQIENKKVTIPQTGGIGTIIFTVVGLSIMSVAVLSLRKRKTTESR